MKKTIFLISTLLITVTSCKKKEECELKSEGTLSINNSSEKDYFIYLNDKYLGEAPAGLKTEFYTETSTYHVKAINQETATEVLEADVSINECEASTVSI